MRGQRLADLFEQSTQRTGVVGDFSDELEGLQATAVVLDEQPRTQRSRRQDASDAERSDYLGRLEERRGVVGQGRDSPARRLARADESAL